MIFINVRYDDSLNIIAKIFADKCFCYPVDELRRDVVIRRKTLYVVNCFHRSFSIQRRRTIKTVACELLINELHLHICGLGIRHAIYRGRVKQFFGFAGVENIPQTFLDSSVDSDTFTVRDSSLTSFLRISTSSA